MLVEAIHLPCDFNELKPQVPHSSWDWQRIYEKVTHENIFACLVAKATVSLVFMLINIRALRPPTVSLGLCSQVHFQVYKKHVQRDVFNEERWNYNSHLPLM